MLVDTFKTDCVMMDKRSVSDGEGGFVLSWVDGAPFRAAVVRDSSTLARIAEKDGLTNLYTVTTDKNARLNFHDVFKRLSDGQIFRVTSNADDRQTPAVASFDFSQVTAEEWRLS